MIEELYNLRKESTNNTGDDKDQAIVVLYY